MAKLVAQFYSKLPLILTLMFVPTKMDVLHYFPPLSHQNILTTLIRTVLLLVSWTEICRLVALAIFFVLFTMNVLKRETKMWLSIAKRSRLRGFYLYRQLAVVYNQRRVYAMREITLIAVVGFLLQVS